MVILKSTIIILSILVMIVSQAESKLLVNEIMANEPGSNTLLEWIEIYNDSTTTRNLAYATMYVDGTSYQLGLHTVGSVEPYEYAVLCKNKVLFDSAYGDNSGVWGDDLDNEYYAVYEVTGFSLINISGTVALQYFSESSSLTWSASGLDGFSWERIHRDSTTARQSIDPTGSTPGRINSAKLLDNNLALDSIIIMPYEGGLCRFLIPIINAGTDTVHSGSLNLYYNDDLDSTYEETDLIAELTYNTIDPGDTVTIEYYDIFFGVFANLIFVLPTDEDTTDNLQLVKAYGIDYPPVIINEFLANPEYESGIEWVEIRNYLNEDINIKGWSLGDSIAYRPITLDDYILSANSYLVLCKDSAALADQYNDPAIPILEMASWSTLNDSYDIIRIKDNYDLTADSVSYGYTYDSDVTWGRSESEEDLYSWGRSTASGGSPGYQNSVYTVASSNNLKLEVANNPLALSSGNEMEINFDSPAGENLIIRIYDLEGRVVKTLFNSETGSFDGTIYWNGTDNSGRNLKIGIYILYAEVSGVDSYKQTVVIAP